MREGHGNRRRQLQGSIVQMRREVGDNELGDGVERGNRVRLQTPKVVIVCRFWPAVSIVRTWLLPCCIGEEAVTCL